MRYRNVYKYIPFVVIMVGKRVAVVLFIIALVLVALVAVNYFVQSDKKISTTSSQGKLLDNGNGKVGVVILPPQIEDKGNGS